MKKGLFLVLVLFLALALTVGAFAFDNEPEGWEELKWGDAPAEDMVEVEVGAYVGSIEFDRYKRGATLLIRLASEISYYFRQDKLAMVTWDIFTEEQYRLFDTFLRHYHGEPTDTQENTTLWESDETEVVLFFDFTEGGFMLLASTRLIDEAIKEEAN